MNKIYGIDPGKTTGMALCKDGKLISVFDVNFWGCIEVINDNSEDMFIIELPNSKHVWHNQATSKKAIQRTGVNVGSAIREAELIIEFMLLNNIEHITQHNGGCCSRHQKRQKGSLTWKHQTIQRSSQGR